MRGIIWRLGGERPLFRSHRPAFQEPARQVGRVVEHDGRLYRITRRVEQQRVRLGRGGSVEEWEIWGRPVSDSELRETLDQEMLRDSEPDRPETG